MIFDHLRARRLIPFFAEELLAPVQYDRVRRHVAACPHCAAQLATLQETVAALRMDQESIEESRLSTRAMVARIESRLDEARVPLRTRARWPLRVPLLATALAASLAILATGIRPPEPESEEPMPAVVSDETLDRLERNLQREGIARYLSEAGDVLVATTGTVADCENSTSTVDLASAPGTSRDLLARRVQLVASGAPPFAEPVLDDVEYALRDVAELPSCARRADVTRVRNQIERRQLLLRMRLAVRELEG